MDEKSINANLIKGLYYTVQIGVYSKPVSPSVLFNIKPINSLITEVGQIRYTTGIFATFPEATVLQENIVVKGVTDAYVTPYYNGKRISLEEANKLLSEKGVTILFNSPENQ